MSIDMDVRTDQEPAQRLGGLTPAATTPAQLPLLIHNPGTPP